MSAKKKGDAERALRQDMTDADRGFVFESGTLTIGDYLAKWLPNMKDTVRQRSWERYEQLVRVHVKPALGSVKLKDLTRAHVKNLYSEKLDAGSSPRTVQYIHTTVHKALKDAMIDGLVPKNVAEGIKPSKPKKKEINPLTPQQAKALLKVAKDAGDRYEALYVLAIHYGLRQASYWGSSGTT